MIWNIGLLEKYEVLVSWGFLGDLTNWFVLIGFELSLLLGIYRIHAIELDISKWQKAFIFLGYLLIILVSH